MFTKAHAALPVPIPSTFIFTRKSASSSYRSNKQARKKTEAQARRQYKTCKLHLHTAVAMRKCARVCQPPTQLLCATSTMSCRWPIRSHAPRSRRHVMPLSCAMGSRLAMLVERRRPPVLDERMRE